MESVKIGNSFLRPNFFFFRWDFPLLGNTKRASISAGTTKLNLSWELSNFVWRFVSFFLLNASTVRGICFSLLIVFFFHLEECKDCGTFATCSWGGWCWLFRLYLELLSCFGSNSFSIFIFFRRWPNVCFHYLLVFHRKRFSLPNSEAVACVMCLHSGGTRLSINVAKVSLFETVSDHNSYHPLMGMWLQLSFAYMFDFHIVG